MSAAYTAPISATTASSLRSHVSVNRTKEKDYDYLLKFLLVGDSDVGKEELISGMEDGATESPYGYACGGKYHLETTP